MHVYYSDRHRAHRGQYEFFRGELVPCFEKPERADMVLAAIQARRIGPVLEPAPFDLARIERVHTPRYLRFLERAWDAWSALGQTRDALPAVWPIRGMRHDVEPDNFVAQLGLYSFDSGTPFTAGTWLAARTGAEIALTAAQHVASGRGRAAFALSRPPGHHAGPDFLGGYCFLNNAAIAAQAFRDDGAQRVAVLDVDYHHGNGTQTIFYERADVLFLSIHGDPRTEYPFYLGHADERGAGPGVGFNVNYPLPAGCDNARGSRPWTTPARASRNTAPTRWWSRLAWTRSPAIRSRRSSSDRPNTSAWANAWPASRFPRCSCSKAAMRWPRSATTWRSCWAASMLPRRRAEVPALTFRLNGLQWSPSRLRLRAPLRKPAPPCPAAGRERCAARQ